MTVDNKDKKKRLRNVASAESVDSSFIYDCRVNEHHYQCELDTAASDIFLSKVMAEKWKLPITPKHDQVTLGDGTTVSTIGIATAVVQVGAERSEEQIHLLDSDVDTGVLTLGRSWGKKHEPNLNWKDYSMVRTKEDGTTVRILPKDCKPEKTTIIKRMSFKKMAKEIRKRKCELYMARMVNTESSAPTKENLLSASRVKSAKEYQDLIDEFSDVFRQELPDELPPDRAFEFEINTDPTQPPASRPVIRLSWEEQKELKKQLDELLRKGLIRHSTSPFGAPIFFIKKKDGALRMVCDYRGLNKMTIKDSNPLPLIEETLDQLAEAKVFSKFDLVGAYHQLRIREQDIHKTAIRTRFGNFEWRVLCFGLTNAPAAFTRLAADIFKELNGDCLAFYLDDVIIYSKSVEEHREHLRKFLTLLRRHKLLAKGSKCEVGQPEVYYLGQYVSEGQIRMDDSLVKAVEDWPEPKNVKEIQKFLGLSGYYRKFIKDYAKVARPISDLVRQNSFAWEDDQRAAFHNLKQALVSAPVLALPRIGIPFTVTTDASKFAVGATLEQEGRPVAYLSHRLTDAEMNWHTGDQELLAFLISLQKWDVYLRGASFVLNTDHEPIRYLQSKPRLSPRQQRWLDIFQQYDFTINHVRGIHNVAADALSRRADLQLKRLCRREPDVRKAILEAQERDNFSRQMKLKLADPEQPSTPTIEKQFKNFAIDGEMLVWTGSGHLRSYVPNEGNLRKIIVHKFHEDSHFGASKIYGSAAQYVYWRRMFEDIQRWVAGCKTCRANKVERQRTAGLLTPHDIPNRCWEHITTDFVTEFPQTKRGYNAVMVVVDKLSKRVVLVPMKKTTSAEEVAHLFEAHVFSKFGVPERITSDRDTKFTARYWKSILKSKGIKTNMATRDHPQTDGQSERSIQTLISILRPVIQTEPGEWDRFLPSAEYEINAAKQESTQLTPFEVDIGRIPRKPLTRNLEGPAEESEGATEFIERQEAFVNVARDHLFAAREAQRYYADKNRRDRQFKQGDWVMLQAEGVKASKRAELPTKWRPRFMGPVAIIEKIGEVSYRVELPPSMAHAHNVVHVSRLKPYEKDELQDGVDIIIDADGNVEQEVETILQHRGPKRDREFLVKFVGHPDKDAEWMTRADLRNAQTVVNTYEASLKKTRTSS